MVAMVAESCCYFKSTRDSTRPFHPVNHGVYQFGIKSFCRFAQDLTRAGFIQIGGAGKFTHRKLTHRGYPRAVTLGGKAGDDAKPCQEKQVKQAIVESQP